MNTDYASKLSVMRRLAIQAGHKIMEIYNYNDFQVETKADESPVTVADQQADALIFAGLRTAFPEAMIVTEEQADTHNQVVQDFFIVDPLDGTKEFIHRRGDFTVNIAWIENGTPKLGVVYAPAKGRLFYTDSNGLSVEEKGQHDPEIVGVTEPLNVMIPDMGSVTVVASKSHRDVDTDNYIAKYNVIDMRSAGSSLKFCLIAAGEADLYPRLGRTMEWDTAAGHAVLIGAGGHVVEFATLKPLQYGKVGFDNPHFIAFSEGIILA